jgi:hypothetical protein
VALTAGTDDTCSTDATEWTADEVSVYGIGVNGAAVPVSAALLATNAQGQLIAASTAFVP